MYNSSPGVTGKKTETSSVQPRAYRINDACKILGISRSHLYVQIEKGLVHLIKIGGRSLIPASEIDRLLNGVSTND